MSDILKDELLFYLGELTASYESSRNSFDKKKLYDKMAAICLLLGIQHVEFNMLYSQT